MPIYEYKCPNCLEVTSRLSRLGDDGTQLQCETCGNAGLEKVFSTFASPKRGTGGNTAQGPMPCHGCGDSASCPRKLD